MHRNLLLPFHSSPAIDDIRPFEDECEGHGKRRRGKPEELDNSEGSDVTYDSEDDELYIVTQESDRHVSMPTQHTLNPDASEFIPTGNREQELISEGTELPDISHQATPDSLASSSGETAVVQTENRVGTRRSGRQRKPP